MSKSLIYSSCSNNNYKIIASHEKKNIFHLFAHTNSHVHSFTLLGFRKLIYVVNDGIFIITIKNKNTFFFKCCQKGQICCYFLISDWEWKPCKFPYILRLMACMTPRALNFIVLTDLTPISTISSNKHTFIHTWILLAWKFVLFFFSQVFDGRTLPLVIILWPTDKFIRKIFAYAVIYASKSCNTHKKRAKESEQRDKYRMRYVE